MSIPKRSRLILALDETDRDKALNVAKAVGDIVIVSRASLPLEEGDEVIEQTVDLSEEPSSDAVEAPVM